MSGFAFHYLHGLWLSLHGRASRCLDELQRGAGLEMVGMFSPADGEVLILGDAADSCPSAWVDVLIPIGFFASTVAIVLAVVVARHHLARRRLDLARAMVERGLEPPPDLLGQRGEQPPTHLVDLRRGVVLCSLGVGIVVTGLVSGEPLEGLGMIPGFIGVGYLLTSWLLGGGRRG